MTTDPVSIAIEALLKHLDEAQLQSVANLYFIDDDIETSLDLMLKVLLQMRRDKVAEVALIDVFISRIEDIRGMLPGPNM